jgi:hypothetical protein
MMTVKVVLISLLGGAPVLIAGFLWVRRNAEAEARLSGVERRAAEAGTAPGEVGACEAQERGPGREDGAD